MIPATPDIGQNIQNALAGLNRNLEQYPHSHCAAVLAQAYGRYLRYCEEDGLWRFWNGLRWQHESALAVINTITIHLIVTHIHPMLSQLTPYQRSAMLGHGYLNNALKQLQLVKRLHVKLAAFDANPVLVGAPSCVLDLTNGNVLVPTPEMMITMQMGCDPAGRREKTPQWDAFIKWLTCGDKELARFLRMWFGASLFGNSRDQKIGFFWGDSANGKSVLLRAIAKAAGDYHATAAPSLFMAHGKSGNSTGLTPGLIKILRKRIVTGTEVPKGAEWDNQTIKQTCSDEAIAARQLYQAEVDIEPRCSITLAGNDLPAFTGLDDAVKRRFFTVHCRAKRAADEQIADYGLELFNAEGPGIVRWILDGAAERENKGFWMPKAVVDASKEYFESEDVLAQFIADEYERDPDGVVGTTDLFTHWQSYNKGLGRPRDLTMTSFALRLRAMGLEKGLHDRTRRSVIKGLRAPGGAWNQTL